MTILKQEEINLNERLLALKKTIDDQQVKVDHDQPESKSEEAEVKKGGRACADNDMNETIGAMINDITDPALKKTMRTVLTNQWNHLIQCNVGMTGSRDFSSMDPIFMCMTRKIMRDLYHTFTPLISIQPMSGPVGLSEVLRSKQRTDEGEHSILVQEPIEAGSRKLSASFTIEAAQDLNSMYGLDLEHELMHALANEITHELSQEILIDLKHLGRKTKGDWKDHVNPHFAYEFAGGDELLRQIQIRIKRIKKHCMHNIKHDDRFFAVVSPEILAHMQGGKNVKYVPVYDDKPAGLGSRPIELSGLPVTHVGTVDDNIDIYVDYHADNDILVGFKGSTDVCTGYVYSPYIPVMSHGIVVDPTTFQPLVCFMTRYGKGSPRKVDQYAGDGSDFYSTFTVEHNAEFVPPTTEPDLELEALIQEFAPEKEMIETHGEMAQWLTALSEKGIDPQDATEEDYAEVKKALTKTIENPETASVRRVATQMIVNQYFALKEEGRDFTIRPALQIIRKVCAELYPVLFKLVGVQPMNHESDVGLGYRLTYQKQEENKMTLNIISTVVHAVTERLQPDATITGGSIHDGDENYFNVIGHNIADEILAGIYSDLVELGKHSDDGEENAVKPTDPGMLGIMINRAANEIARKTRRGAGNFVVVSRTVFNLMTKNVSYFKPEPQHGDLLCYTGKLNGNINVFINEDAEDDDMLVGYKGNSDTDTGYIYSPHTQIILSETAMDPTTFDFDVEVLSKRGKTMFNEDGMGKSHNYYQYINVDLSEMKEWEPLKLDFVGEAVSVLDSPGVSVTVLD